MPGSPPVRSFRCDVTAQPPTLRRRWPPFSMSRSSSLRRELRYRGWPVGPFRLSRFFSPAAPVAPCSPVGPAARRRRLSRLFHPSRLSARRARRAFALVAPTPVAPFHLSRLFRRSGRFPVTPRALRSGRAFFAGRTGRAFFTGCSRTCFAFRPAEPVALFHRSRLSPAAPAFCSAGRTGHAPRPGRALRPGPGRAFLAGLAFRAR